MKPCKFCTVHCGNDWCSTNGDVVKKDVKKEPKTMVDPPGGWKYGFPKELKDGVEYEDLLRASKYPEKDIPLALKFSRYWRQPQDG